MKASGKTTKRAPLLPASEISSQALSSVLSRSRTTGAAWTAAILKGNTLFLSFPLGKLILLHRYGDTLRSSTHLIKRFIHERPRREILGSYVGAGPSRDFFTTLV